MINMNEFGQEVPNDEPVVIRFKGRCISQFDEVRAYIRRELSANRADAGAETFDEANDFEVDGDPFPVSAHEYEQDTEDADREVLHAGIPRQDKGASTAPIGAATSAAGVQPAAAPPPKPEA